MNRKHIIITMIISAVATVLNCVINLIITPLVTNSIGVEAYGFVTLAKNFTYYANIFMLALNSYAARYLSVSYLKGDNDSFKRFYTTILISDIVIGGSVFLVGVICTLFLEKLINIPVQLLSGVKLLFLLTFIAFYFTTTSTVFAATAYVKDKLNIYSMIRSMSLLTQIMVLLFGFVLCKPQVWYVGIATLSTALVVFIGSYLIKKHYLSGFKVEKQFFDINSIKTLTSNGIWNSLNNVGNVLNSGLDLLITNLMLTTVGMGQISIAKTISTLIGSLYGVLGQPFQPEMLKRYTANETNELLHIFTEAMRVSGLVTNIVIAGFISVGEIFLELWIPGEDNKIIYILAILALLPSVSEGCVQPLYYIYTLTVKNKIPCIITIIGGAVNVVSMFVLIKYTKLGVFAVLITTAVVMNIINFVTNPLYMCHVLGVKWNTFYKQIWRSVLSCVIATVVMKSITLLFPCSLNWISLMVHAFILLLIGIGVQVPVQFGFIETKRMIVHYIFTSKETIRQ